MLWVCFSKKAKFTRAIGVFGAGHLIGVGVEKKMKFVLCD